MRQFIFELKNWFSDSLLSGAEIGVERGDNTRDILHVLKVSKLTLVDIWAPFV